MRVLVLMRGAMGCGKSTFIKEHGWEPYTLCADNIRMLAQSPVLDVDGNPTISQQNDKVTWRILFELLENRMKRGDFTVIDATNTKTVEMNRYKKLADKYRYRIYCIDMTDVPIEVAKERNRQRDPLKFVPEAAIDRAYARFANQKIPSGITVLKPNETDKILYQPIDLSSYDKVHVIGDIHGCYTALKQFMDSQNIDGNEYFIFLGDYLDRGIELGKTLNYLMDISEKYRNVTFLEGNHEGVLRHWASDESVNTKEFRQNTAPALEGFSVGKKRARIFCRKLAQCMFFKYDDSIILVTHGGISTIPKNNLVYVATEQMIKGVGNYESADYVDSVFMNTTPYNYVQVHGHRNENNTPIRVNEATFNLNGNVERGGYLRAVTFTHGGVTETHEIKNDIYYIPEDVTQTDEQIINKDIADIVAYMRASKNIEEKSFGDISSFNFTRSAFRKREWNGMTTKARGLYIDTKNNEIVARGYEKFFNYKEREETMPEVLATKLKFPVSVYVKENGYLGILSTDHNGELIFATKSSLTGDHAKWFKENMFNIYGADTVEKLRRFAFDNNVSFVFEVIDIVNDPHVIEYKQNDCILLDIIFNDIKFHKMPYIDVCDVANKCGVSHKILDTIIEDYEGLISFINKATKPNFIMATDRIDDQCIEGFVFEDENGFMFKLKTHYYNHWKMLRGVASQTFKNGFCNFTGGLQSVESNYFYGWCKDKFNTLGRDKSKEYLTKDIITLRDEFFADNPLDIDVTM